MSLTGLRRTIKPASTIVVTRKSFYLTHIHTNKMKHKRNRDVIWFNPPWSNNIKTNIAEKFLQLIDVFQEKIKGTPLGRIFTRSTGYLTLKCPKVNGSEG